MPAKPTPDEARELQRIRANRFQGEMFRAVAPHAIAAAQLAKGRLSVTQRRQGDHYLITEVIGPPADVALYCGWVVGSDRCTQMYEFMLTRVASVTDNPDGTLTVVLSKSNYAGD